MADPTPTPPGSIAPYTCTPELGDAGGALVRIPPGTVHAVIENPRLRAVDIVCGDTLRILDLRGCRPGVHLGFVLYAHLERLLLPAGGSGAVLHFPIASPRRAFAIEGAIDHITAAWPDADGSLATLDYCTRRNAAPAVGAYLGPPDGGGQGGAANPQVVVLIGGVVSEGLLDSISTSARFILMHDCEAMGGVRLAGHVDEFIARKSRVSSFGVASAQRISVQECGDLTRIEGHIAHLAIRGGANVDRLRIDGYVGNADLADIDCDQLEIPAVRRMKMRGIVRVDTIRTLGAGAAEGWSPNIRVRGHYAPVIEGNHYADVEPLTADDIYETFVHGTEVAQQGMLRWARQCDNSAHYWLALRVFAMAVDAGEQAEPVWIDRCVLHDRHGGRHGWAWRFPEDLAARGWSADVRLWLRCLAAQSPSARAYARTMTRAAQPAPIATLLLTATGDDISEGEQTLLLKMCRAAARGGWERRDRLDVPPQPEVRPRQSEGLTTEQETWLWHCVRSLTKLADHPASGETADGLARWIATCAPTTEGVRLIGWLAAHGSPQAGVWLLRLRTVLPLRNDIDDDMRADIGRAIAHQLVQESMLPRFVMPPPIDDVWEDEFADEEEAT